jgi:hypothetical protein
MKKAYPSMKVSVARAALVEKQSSTIKWINLSFQPYPSFDLGLHLFSLRRSLTLQQHVHFEMRMAVRDQY